MLLKQLMSSYLAAILREKWQRNPNCIQSTMVAMVKVFSISDTQTKCILCEPISLGECRFLMNKQFHFYIWVKFIIEHLGEIYNSEF